MTRLHVALPLFLLATSTTLRAQDSPHGVRDTAYVAGAYRVFTGVGAPASIEDVVAEMGRHQVVFVGEAHDDPTGHMLEAELFRRAYDSYGAAGVNQDAPRSVVLSLEFFERDVQPVLDEYLGGLISERSFRNDSRPWPRYETDYRPLIEFAREHGLRVVAANAPRRYISRVSQYGRESLNELSPSALQTLAPLPYGEPSQAYRQQWIRAIQEVIEQEGKKCGVPVAPNDSTVHAPAPMGSHAAMGNQMQSQVLWDATMAHSISQAIAAQPDALVLHMVGGFHVERGTGIPEQLQAYRPGTSQMIIALRPVQDVSLFEPAPDGEWGTFVIQTEKSRTLEEIECRTTTGHEPPAAQRE